MPALLVGVLASFVLLHLLGPLADAAWPVALAGPDDGISVGDTFRLAAGVVLVVVVGTVGAWGTGSWQRGAVASGCCAFVAAAVSLCPPLAAHAQLPFLACVDRGDEAFRSWCLAETLVAAVSYPWLAAAGAGLVGAVVGTPGAMAVAPSEDGGEVFDPLAWVVAAVVVGPPALVMAVPYLATGFGGVVMVGSMLWEPPPHGTLSMLLRVLVSSLVAFAPPLVVLVGLVGAGRRLPGLLPHLPWLAMAAVVLAASLVQLGLHLLVRVAFLSEGGRAMVAGMSGLAGGGLTPTTIRLILAGSVVLCVVVLALGALLPREVPRTGRPVVETLEATALLAVCAVAVVQPLLMSVLSTSLGAVSFLSAAFLDGSVDMSSFQSLRTHAESLRIGLWLGLVGRVLAVGSVATIVVGLSTLVMRRARG